MTRSAKSKPSLLILIAGLALSLSAYSAARGGDPPEEGAELRAVIKELLERTATLEERVRALEACHPRLTNAALTQRLQAVAARHNAGVTVHKARARAETLSFGIEMKGSSLKSVALFRQALRDELVGAGRCLKVLVDKVTISSNPEVMSFTVKLTRPPLK